MILIVFKKNVADMLKMVEASCPVACAGKEHCDLINCMVSVLKSYNPLVLQPVSTSAHWTNELKDLWTVGLIGKSPTL